MEGTHEEHSKETIKNIMTDSKKISEAIAKIKKDRKLVAQSVDMVRKNPQLERNMTSIAREIMGTEGVMGPETSLKDRKKMLHKQALIRSQMKMNLTEDDIKCTVMSPKGKVSSMIVNLPQLELEEKWCVNSIMIGDLDFLTICDSSASLSNKNLNKRASALMGMHVYGLVSFVLLDNEYDPVDSLPKDFPSQ